MNNMHMNETTFPAQTENLEPFETRCNRVLQVAKDLFQRNPDWVTFFREVLGVSGAARNVFRTNQDYLAFEQSTEYGNIQQMVSSLRNRKIPGGGHNEPTRVITVRLPESLHEALKVEATDHRTSMNKLCISKLLQVLADSEAAQQAAKQGATRSQVPQPPTHMQPQTHLGSQSTSHPASRPPVPSLRSSPPVPQPSTSVPQPSNPVPQPSRPLFGNPVPTPNRNPVPAPASPVDPNSVNPNAANPNAANPVNPSPTNPTNPNPVNQNPGTGNRDQFGNQI